jgi:hypothetical protein
MPAKRSGCVVSPPVLIMIFLFASLLAAALLVGVPYLQGRPEFPPGKYPLFIDGNDIMVEMDPSQEVFLVPLGGLDPGTGGQTVGQIATGTPVILPTPGPVATVTPPILPSPPPPTLTPRPQMGCVIFTNHPVQAGETLFSISRRYVTSIPLMARHGISSTSLVPGAVIAVPVGDPSCCTGGWRPYVVEDGETWFSIAQSCGISVDALYQGNGVSAGATLYMASVICVP